MKVTIACLALVMAPATPVTAEATAPASEPVNLDFELGEPGAAPQGWLVPRESLDHGYSVELTTDDASRGARSAVIRRDQVKGERPTEDVGNLMQKIDAVPYRGKRVRFSAAVRTEVRGRGNHAQLWLRVDRAKKKMGFFDNMFDRPITGKDWQRYEIVGDVAEDAVTLNFGVFLVGWGRVWFDDASLEIVDEAAAAPRPH
jgi:hypothetical protein